MTKIEIRRRGQYWEAKDGTVFTWDEEREIFLEDLTGDTYKLTRRISDDLVQIQNAMIICVALETLKNAYDQVLFLKGNKYIADKSGSRYFLFNELHTETPFNVRKFRTYFEIL